MEQLVFYLFATVSVIAAILVIVQKRAIYSALALIVCLGAMAVLFYQLSAHFIAAIQVIVYAGAVMVLFVFVVMLVDPESEVFSLNRVRRVTVAAVPLVAFLGFGLYSALGSVPQFWAGPGEGLEGKGDVDTIAGALFSDYLLPFEVTSILILVAVVGAMVLAKRTER